MISKIKTSLILGALLVTPMIAASASSAQFLSRNASDDPVSFCCVAINPDDTNAQGCYAVQNGTQGINQCKYVYYDCGGDSFECVPSQTAAPAGGVPFGTTLKDCYCFDFLVPKVAASE
jgi:hypothetical protein